MQAECYFLHSCEVNSLRISNLWMMTLISDEKCFYHWWVLRKAKCESCCHERSSLVNLSNSVHKEDGGCLALWTTSPLLDMIVFKLFSLFGFFFRIPICHTNEQTKTGANLWQLFLNFYFWYMTQHRKTVIKIKFKMLILYIFSRRWAVNTNLVFMAVIGWKTVHHN